MAQVSVSCLEHGRLLDRLRNASSGVFSEFKRVLELFIGFSGSMVPAFQSLQRDSDAQYDRHQVPS